MAQEEANKDKDRYCTPRPIRRKLIQQFGGLPDLDPCWDPNALQLGRVQYDIRQGHDGLRLPWFGSVFCNPPYSNPGPWLQRAAMYARYGLAETVALVNVATATNYWAQWVWPQAAAIRFLTGRVDFLYEGVPVKGNRHEQVLIYYGPRPERFWRTWGYHSNLGPLNRLTVRSGHAKVARMADDFQNDQSTLMRMLGPAVLFQIYERVKGMTVEEIVESAMPVLHDFVMGYELAREQREVEFDDPEDEAHVGGNGHDPDPPEDYGAQPKSGGKGKKKSKKKKPKRAKQSGAKKASKKTGKKKASASPGSTGDLDSHVLTLLKARGDWTPSRDLRPLISGVSDNQLRKSLARLVSRGDVKTRGKTKSKVYAAASAV